ncbi:MAG: Na+:solute symporter [Ignavibacteriae bacterium]|nr:Na+:solute symporter [Ignavibacteriota bacterium]MCB9243138.1 Na+:solute symporter [Ignavibacteriales bacterium]
MQLLDWAILLFYFILTLGIGLYFIKKAGGNIEDFFLSGRKLPWWLAGLSMVATTFAADTPLAVAGLVGKNGIAGNWLWWTFLIGGMLTVFFFARLWRRADILTDVEFIELRYSGKPAALLRGFKSIYLGLFMNVLIIGWVNLAMAKILMGMFPEYVTESNVLFFIGGCMLITAIYSALSGLWGVVVTDAVQFSIAMLGCIILAIIVVNQPEVGGVSGLQEKLPEWAFQFLPSISADTSAGDAAGIFSMTIASFLAFIGIQWWASWYPGAEPGGGGYIAQRMMSAKDEKNSLLATLFFQIAHYAIRPWPWIIVGLSAIILYPDLPADGKEIGFVYAMNDFLPTGLRGLLLAAFFGAYMSTISTQLNWGTSYFVNDFFKRFITKDKPPKYYVGVSRILTIVVMVLSILVTTQMKNISGVWEFVLSCGAGIGLVLILRWFWWRVNAWAEIAATVIPFAVYGYLELSGTAVEFPNNLFIIVPITTIAWMIIMFITKPTEENKLHAFYKKVHPGGIGWKKFALQYPDIKPDRGYGFLFIDWICGVVLVYMFLFGTGKIIFGDYITGILFLIIALISAGIIYWDLNRRGWEKLN